MSFPKIFLYAHLDDWPSEKYLDEVFGWVFQDLLVRVDVTEFWCGIFSLETLEQTMIILHLIHFRFLFSLIPHIMTLMRFPGACVVLIVVFHWRYCKITPGWRGKQVFVVDLTISSHFKMISNNWDVVVVYLKGNRWWNQYSIINLKILENRIYRISLSILISTRFQELVYLYMVPEINRFSHYSRSMKLRMVLVN